MAAGHLRAGPAGSRRGALARLADRPAPPRHDAAPPCRPGPRARRRPAGGCRPSGASIVAPARAAARRPTRSRAPRSTPTSPGPSRRRGKGRVAGRSARAIRALLRVGTPPLAPSPRRSPRPLSAAAVRLPSRAAATATGARGRAVSRGGGGRPSGATSRGSPRADGSCPRYPPAQIRRPAIRPGTSSHRPFSRRFGEGRLSHDRHHTCSPADYRPPHLMFRPKRQIPRRKMPTPSPPMASA
jgi:hypothetical protein